MHNTLLQYIIYIIYINLREILWFEFAFQGVYFRVVYVAKQKVPKTLVFVWNYDIIICQC